MIVVNVTALIGFSFGITVSLTDPNKMYVVEIATIAVIVVTTMMINLWKK